jgi:hypothetical protein
MLLVIDMTARAIFAAQQVDAFLRCHHAVSLGAMFLAARHGFLVFKPTGFAAGQFTAANALIDAPLLITFAPIDSGRMGAILRISCDAQAQYKNSSEYYTNDSLHCCSPMNQNLVSLQCEW